MISLVLDLLLVIALLWSSIRSLTSKNLFLSVVLFIVFSLLMVLAWARLDAPDIALAEAAISTGITSALLLDTVGYLRSKNKSNTHEKSN